MNFPPDPVRIAEEVAPAAQARVELSRPSICLVSVPFGSGETLNFVSLSLEQARMLRDLLTQGIDRYFLLYGDGEKS